MNDPRWASSADEDMLCIRCVFKKKRACGGFAALHQTDLSWVTARRETKLAAGLARSLGPRTSTELYLKT